MTHQIGSDAFFNAFEDFTLGKSKSVNEIDIIDEDLNFVLEGEGEGYTVDISFVFIPSFFDDGERRKDAIKNLVENSVTENDVDFQGYKGRIAVEEVSLPEEGNQDNIFYGSISGIFLPWPMHFPELEEPEDVEIGSFYGYGSYGDGFYGVEISSGDYGYESYNTGDYSK